MSCYAVIPESLPNAWPPAPTDSENTTVHLINVQWLGDLMMGVSCCTCHYDYCVKNVSGFSGLKITDLRSAVKCCAFGLWITVSEPIYDRSVVIGEVISGISKMFGGHLFSAKFSNPAKATQAHAGVSLPHTHKGPIILQTLPAYSPAQMHFAKTIKLQILLNVSGTIKNVYYSTGISR